MKIMIKLLFSLLTTLNLMIHGMKQGVLFWFCPHLDTEQITYYEYIDPCLKVWRKKVCKTCGQLVELYQISEYYIPYYNHANREKIAKQLEAKGIKNLEDL